MSRNCISFCLKFYLPIDICHVSEKVACILASGHAQLGRVMEFGECEVASKRTQVLQHMQ